MGVNGVYIVSVPVADQARARDFYEDVLGFKVIQDSEFAPGQRWVQLEPPGGGTTITLTTWIEEMPPGALKGVYLSTPDVEGSRRELADKGVKLTTEIQRTPWGGFFNFDDPDGNGWTVWEVPAAG